MVYNHLASFTEKMEDAGNMGNNSGIADRLKDLQKTTNDVKSLLTNQVSEMILQNLYVVNYNSCELTITVKNITARNHLSYMSQGIINTLHQSPKFKDLQILNVKVVHLRK